MIPFRSTLLLGCLLVPGTVLAGDLLLKPAEIAEMKAVYGQVQAKDQVLARARIPGTLVELAVSEGDMVAAGDVIARIKDDRTNFQIGAVDAQLLGLKASLANARAELERGRQLLKSGTSTAQRVDQLQTQVDVLDNQIRSAEASRSVLVEQAAQGAVLAPSAGKVLSVPVTRQAVVMAGETVATIAGGGFFLRLAIPERHAAALREGSQIAIDASGKALSGRLAKIYPEILGGRVTADVEVEGLPTEFVGARVLVELPVGSRKALMVPASAVATRAGIDFVPVREDGKVVERAVMSGDRRAVDGVDMVEILTGLSEGETVIVP
ncbi:efflux RND transporter periplasmic adaptor subunit [Gellertiella hungarica]|uniref:RND family efflux transporter MFP subunit n=1 Tax=Gellertiella hungarica TaxID=1572859 RepID=A0A7W6J7I6_9HYPH|nr:efflux RND transporter periplasmic adaptor subunit [Gellertiella hungarica]MBB4065372.1 RND family efflux transporter MFP subunit [Gellertiella hungarica]